MACHQPHHFTLFCFPIVFPSGRSRQPHLENNSSQKHPPSSFEKSNKSSTNNSLFLFKVFKRSSPPFLSLHPRLHKGGKEGKFSLHHPTSKPTLSPYSFTKKKKFSKPQIAPKTMRCKKKEEEEHSSPKPINSPPLQGSFMLPSTLPTSLSKTHSSTPQALRTVGSKSEDRGILSNQEEKKNCNLDKYTLLVVLPKKFILQVLTTLFLSYSKTVSWEVQ